MALLAVTIVDDHTTVIVMIHWFIIINKNSMNFTSETGCIVRLSPSNYRLIFRSMPIIGLCSWLNKSQPYENLFLSLDFVFWHKLQKYFSGVWEGTLGVILGVHIFFQPTLLVPRHNPCPCLHAITILYIWAKIPRVKGKLSCCMSPWLSSCH